MDALAASVTESSCGVGLDSLLAARRVESSGKVMGEDMTPEIIEQARRNAGLLGLHNVEFVNTGIERLPMPNPSVDVATSNGVFNLCPDKPGVLAEAFRVLRPGGRLQMSDILLHSDVTPEDVRKRVPGRTESPVPCGGGRSCKCSPGPGLSRAASTAGPATTRRPASRGRSSRPGSHANRIRLRRAPPNRGRKDQ